MLLRVVVAWAPLLLPPRLILARVAQLQRRGVEQSMLDFVRRVVQLLAELAQMVLARAPLLVVLSLVWIFALGLTAQLVCCARAWMAPWNLHFEVSQLVAVACTRRRIQPCLP